MNYYKRGDAANADKIKAAFEKLGYKTGRFDFRVGFFFTCEKEVHYAISDEIANIIKTHPDYTELELPIEPCFKVGDSLQSGSHFTKILSINLEEGRYYCDNRIISFENQDLWHSVPKPHYDIANFKPFDKVLVRDGNGLKWTADLFSYIGGAFVCTGDIPCRQCIPYNDDTKHLLGTTDMPSEEYINW